MAVEQMEDPYGWDGLISDFEKDVWPTMEKHGFRKDNAFNAYMLNQVFNAIRDHRIEVVVTDEMDEALEAELEPWQKQQH